MVEKSKHTGCKWRYFKQSLFKAGRNCSYSYRSSLRMQQLTDFLLWTKYYSKNRTWISKL